MKGIQTVKNYATTDFNLQKKLGNVIGKKKASDGIIKILDRYWNLQKTWLPPHESKCTGMAK